MRICSLSVPPLKHEWNQTVWSVNNLRCGTAGTSQDGLTAVRTAVREKAKATLQWSRYRLRQSHRPHHRTRKRAHFPEVLHARELGKSANETKQMTMATAVGAVSSEAAEWYAIDWQAIHRNVRRLQVRIAQATKVGRWGKVRALQRLLTHSYSGKVLAVRRVTENDGKKTPGVDQEIWDTPEKKIQAVHAFQRRGYQPQPLRRVYILKSDKKTMRPLGIPTMTDRSHQALYLLALDPVVETTADKNSYGFRQQRSCADAIEQCFTALSHAPNTQWILEGDIKSCFDRISHDWLLAHVPMDRVILRKWLKAGYMEKHVLHETTDGTPQGGIITLLTQKVIWAGCLAWR
jgi:RNA-directed DNA polymerase